MDRVVPTALRAFGVAGALAASLPAVAQTPTPPSSELLRELERLRVVGSVLYVAAHPDDENTRLLAWLVGERGVRAGYLSMTRGGGGQNLVGSEQAELLDAVRTGELLAARSVDGAEQRFTRARDFGFSKSPDEALAVWGHEEALSDVVLALRTFRPDVVITRFGTSGRTHGHHTASAILAAEAFEAAADPSRFPEHGLPPWQADRLLHNVSSWSLEPSADTSAWLRVDVGGFDPRTGRSWGEVAAESRTRHKSQGFGTAPTVGPEIEYLAPLAGTPLSPGDDLFRGLDLTWSRFPGTGPLRKALDRAVKRFDPRAPAAILPELARVHAHLSAVDAPGWREVKLADLERLMVDCAGLWLTARADARAVVPGESLAVQLVALARAPADVVLREVRLSTGEVVPGTALRVHQPFAAEITADVPADAPLTRPHWLIEPPTAGRWEIPDPAWRVAPDTPPSLHADFVLEVAGTPLVVRRPVEFAWTDPVHGERVHPVEVLPPATATFATRALLVPSGGAVASRVTLRADAGPAEGVLRLEAPAGFEVVPAEVPFALTAAAPEQVVDVRIVARPGAVPGPLRAEVRVGDRAWAWQQAVIDHPHLPRRTVLSPAELPLVPVDLDRGGVQRVGYVVGSGDAVAEVLRTAGYTVEEIDEATLAAGGLERFDAIVTGIRAFNTRPRLAGLRAQLLDYVAGGGRLVVQYNTNARWGPLDEPVGPYPFRIGRDRVTDETAPLVPVDSDHPALRGPNALGPADFEGWVQERGLYFASDWDPAYHPLFETHDPGEAPLRGSTLIARYGEGTFVYTGLSFFRQLPAGVPGALRLFANLLAL